MDVQDFEAIQLLFSAQNLKKWRSRWRVKKIDGKNENDRKVDLLSALINSSIVVVQINQGTNLCLFLVLLKNGDCLLWKKKTSKKSKKIMKSQDELGWLVDKACEKHVGCS